MNFCVKLLSIFLVLVMLASTVVSCAFQPNSNPSTQGGTTTNNGITVLPPNNDDNKEDNNGNHVGGVVVGNVTAPYIGDVHVSAGVTPDENNQVPSEGVSLESATASATIPGGVQMEEGANELALTINGIKDSSANVELSDTDVSSSLDVHVSGVAAGNLVPMEVKLLAAALKGLNSTSITLYHVENGETIEMTYVPNDEPFTAHNQFKYDPATGDVTLYIASFSEIMMVADTVNAWDGTRDYSWYDASKTELTIANADQLAAFGAIVGGMAAGIEQDSFEGKTVKLIADINLGDKESENKSNIIFYPIGYNSSDGKYEKTGVAVTTGFYNFCGTFDGNGHTVANFYQNTWEMKGDNNYYDATLQYYRDGMGLFGRVYGGTVKNLTVKNFSSDGEYTTTGVIAAYADGATFENIAIFDCNPRVYNIGNGGIVGCVGWYAKEAGLTTTFKNITVDNSNKISALWGSYDVACGGIVGQYYPTSGQTSAGTPANGGISFENCHVSAQMDVYNDVCANYQYYAYRYTGMLIGSVRENETIDGHVYPKMDKITASGCTVHFGTWNDYYYCEIIDNTTASYTHDYQMSRLTEIKAIDGTTITYLDGTTGTVPASGRANYVIVDYTKGHGTENATCYHFKDGEVWTHDMGGIQTGIDENGDGKDDLKEDKQHIYLEFNNLVTGYGWGVTTKYVGDLAGVAILDRKVGDSIDKFVGTKDENALKPLTGQTINIGTLFSAKEGIEVALNPSTIIVSVTPLGEDSTVRATYAINESNWTLGTLSLSGVGKAKVTITDYYFCKSTSVIIDVQPVDKFTSKLTGNFLYRVGNQNAIALDSLFGKLANLTVPVDSESVEISISETTNYTFTSNISDWTKATIDFKDYTGIATITIKDASSNTCSMTVEVIDGKNITSNEGTTSGGTFVLLSNINTNTYVHYYNCTLYGNGFTYTLNGAPTSYNSKQGHGILITNNATFDNLVIKGDVYDEYGAYTNNNDYNAAIDVLGETTIQNCYISGCSAPVSTRANVTIINTTLYGGAVANLLIKGGTATLENVTTANYNDGRNGPIGMGIVIHSDAAESAKLIIKGTLTQYNFLNEEDKPSNTYAQNIHTAMFGSGLSKYHFGTSPNRRVNSGIVSMTANFNAEDITDNANTGYTGSTITLNGVNGYVYTQLNTNGSINNGYDINTDPHVSTTQGEVPPIYSFDHTINNVPKTEGSNKYCYEENGIIHISMDEGDSFSWNTSIISLGKGIESYTVTMNGTDYSNKNILFNTAGTYTVIYSYTDTENYIFDENREITTYNKTYNKTITIVVAVIEASAKNAEFTMGSSNTSTEKITVNNTTYISATGVTANNSTWTYITVDDQKIYYPIIAAKLTTTKGSSTYAYFPLFENVITITDYMDYGTGDPFVYNTSTTSASHTPLPIAVKGYYKDAASVTWSNLNDSNLSQSGANKIFKWASSSDAPSSTETYKDVLCYKSPQISANRDPYITLVQYSYTDSTNTTYYYYVGYTLEAFTKSTTPCVTGDTLVTLADGSQVRIDSLTGNELVKVWDFYKGEYTVAPIAILQNHGYSEFDEVKLIFSDGTEINTINGHGFFDVADNKFILIDKYNVTDYVGHEFVKYDAENEYSTVTLVDYSIEARYEQIYSILTAVQYNCLLNDLWTLTAAEVDNSPEWLMPYEIGEDMKYDAEKMQADIEKYGLYTYEDFAGLCTYEEFVALGLENFKVSVGKGAITWEDILFLINLHLN